MRRRRRPDPEGGAAMVEYTVIVAFVLVPLVYLVVLLAEIQSAAFASTAASREAGRVAAAEVAAGHGDVDGPALAAAELVTTDMGHPGATLTLECTVCQDARQPGSVTATSEVTVHLPGLDRIGVAGPSVLTFTATHTEPLDTYRETRGRR